MPDLRLMLAQIGPADAELTVGIVLMGFCTMAVLTGSLSVLAVWWARYSRGESVIPMADRPLPGIPVPLLIFGLLIGVYSVSVALIMSQGNIESAVHPPAPVVENVEEELRNDDVGGSEVTDAGLAQDVLVDTVESATDSQADSADLFDALRLTIFYDIAMIFMLGIPVLIVKLRRNPALNLVRPKVPQSADTMPCETMVTVDYQNPYAATSTSSNLPAQFADCDELAAGTSVELWHFSRELRFAAETCLAAWLPTAILKLTMVMILPEQGQHPFLEMITNGAEPLALLLIAFTAVVLAPLMEELLYRVVILGGMLNHRDRTPLSTSFAIVVTSVLFAFAHGFPDNVALLPFAAAIGWTYYQRRSYRTVVLVHFLFNGFNVLIAGLGMI